MAAGYDKLEGTVESAKGASLDNVDNEPEWAIVVLVASAISFTGSREDAQDHLNAYYAHLETMFKERKLSFVRREHSIVRRGIAKHDGGISG